jgi:hypothetical protein
MQQYLADPLAVNRDRYTKNENRCIQFSAYVFQKIHMVFSKADESSSGETWRFFQTCHITFIKQI